MLFIVYFYGINDAKSITWRSFHKEEKLGKQCFHWKESEHIPVIEFNDPAGWTKYPYPKIVVDSVVARLNGLLTAYPLAFFELMKLASPVELARPVPSKLAEILLREGFIRQHPSGSECTYKINSLVNLIMLGWFNGDPELAFNGKE